MIGLHRDLEKRAQAGRPVRFAIIGAGQMGIDIVSQTQKMQGIEVRAVADLEIARARQAYLVAGIPRERLVHATNVAQANDAVREGKFVMTDRPELVVQIEAVESVVDATGNPEAGAQIALWSFDQKKHLLMMNVEADVTIGPV
ncbi:MAG TPA: NAD(P)-dependent oxidoreductase, partial [Terriglobia bacterium]|nr:NAD(P)-dependent oxidoreductase [Terriglobia bacterium]